METFPTGTATTKVQAPLSYNHRQSVRCGNCLPSESKADQRFSSVVHTQVWISFWNHYMFSFRTSRWFHSRKGFSREKNLTVYMKQSNVFSCIHFNAQSNWSPQAHLYKIHASNLMTNSVTFLNLALVSLLRLRDYLDINRCLDCFPACKANHFDVNPWHWWFLAFSVSTLNRVYLPFPTLAFRLHLNLYKYSTLFLWLTWIFLMNSFLWPEEGARYLKER